MLDLMNSLLEMPIYGGMALGEIFTPDMMLGALLSVLSAIAVLILGYLVAGFASRKIRKLGIRYRELDETLFSFFASVTRYIIIALTLLVVLTGFGVQTTSIVAVIASAGLAIGLALQGTLSNVAAGVMLVFFRPFRIGDFIETNGVIGKVEDITLNYTALADPNNVRVIVPNANVWGSTMTNYSANKARQRSV